MVFDVINSYHLSFAVIKASEAKVYAKILQIAKK